MLPLADCIPLNYSFLLFPVISAFFDVSYSSNTAILSRIFSESSLVNSARVMIFLMSKLLAFRSVDILLQPDDVS